MTDRIDRGRLLSDTKAQAPRPALEDEVEAPPFKPLTRQEAQALQARHPPLSPWVVLGVQALVGLLLSAGVWVIWRQGNMAWSALYGAAAVVIPGALMARGMSRQAGKTNPGEAMVGFMVWEFAKVLAAVAMLVAAVKVVPGLHWPALLVTMIVSLKVNWLVLLWHRPSTPKPEQEIQQHVR
ncbi:MAG: ATP synthase subunit I [Pseudomonadota bacterium]